MKTSISLFMSNPPKKNSVLSNSEPGTVVLLHYGYIPETFPSSSDINSSKITSERVALTLIGISTEA